MRMTEGESERQENGLKQVDLFKPKEAEATPQNIVALVKANKFLDIRPEEAPKARWQRHVLPLASLMSISTASRNFGLWGIGTIQQQLKEDAALYLLEKPPGKQLSHSQRTLALQLKAGGLMEVGKTSVQRGIALHNHYSEQEMLEFCRMPNQVLQECIVLPHMERNRFLRELKQKQAAGGFQEGEMLRVAQEWILKSKEPPSAGKEPEISQTPPIATLRSRMERFVQAFRDILGGVDAGMYTLSDDEKHIIEGIIDSVLDVGEEAKERILKEK